MSRIRCSFNLNLVLQSEMILKNISVTLRLFGTPPIGRWSWNLLGTNILKLGSRGYMMRTLMAGRKRTSMNTVTRRVGLCLSSRQRMTSSSAASQQLNGKPRPKDGSISPAPTRSCSVWMRAANTLSPAETQSLLHVGAICVLYLGLLVNGTLGSILIPIITLKVGVLQICLVTTCLQLKKRAVKRTILPLMEGNKTSHPKNLRCSKYS
jgi:hypothetical protein